jgi:hypothetical protein
VVVNQLRGMNAAANPGASVVFTIREGAERAGLAAPCGPLLLHALVARFSPDGSRTCGFQPTARYPQAHVAVRIICSPGKIRLRTFGNHQ